MQAARRQAGTPQPPTPYARASEVLRRAPPASCPSPSRHNTLRSDHRRPPLYNIKARGSPRRAVGGREGRAAVWGARVQALCADGWRFSGVIARAPRPEAKQRAFVSRPGKDRVAPPERYHYARTPERANQSSARLRWTSASAAARAGRQSLASGRKRANPGLSARAAAPQATEWRSLHRIDARKAPHLGKPPKNRSWRRQKSGNPNPWTADVHTPLRGPQLRRTHCSLGRARRCCCDEMWQRSFVPPLCICPPTNLVSPRYRL